MTPLRLSGFSSEAKAGKRPHPIIPSVRGKVADRGRKVCVLWLCVGVSLLPQHTHANVSECKSHRLWRAVCNTVDLHRINTAGGFQSVFVYVFMYMLECAGICMNEGTGA